MASTTTTTSTPAPTALSQAPPDDSVDPRSRDVTGCMLWKDYSELERGGLNSILSHFQRQCQSPDFTAVWADVGFDGATFHANGELQPSRPSYDKFLEGLKNLDRNATFGVVFHGTSPGNIKGILQNGLDPSRRSGQAYGPGEYFSKEPSVSVSYCRGGLEMIVFVVVLPSTLATDPQEQQKQNASRYMPLRIPADYVVVQENNHQIPIGTMKFTKVDAAVMQASQAKRAKFLQLSREVFQKSQVSKEARIKAEIIQHLIVGKIDLASERFQRHFGTLSLLSRREISWYVHQKVDEEVIFFYFEDLPEPLRPEEIETAKVQSLDDATHEEEEAKKLLEEERKKDARNRLSMSAQNVPFQYNQPAATAPWPLFSATPASLQQIFSATPASLQQTPLQLASQQCMPDLSQLTQQAQAAQGSRDSREPRQTRRPSQQLSALGLQPPQQPAFGMPAAPPPFQSQNCRRAPSYLSTVTTPKLDPATTILQHLIKGRADMASEMWSKHREGLDEKEKIEIATFAKLHIIDHNVMGALFPGLPVLGTPGTKLDSNETSNVVPSGVAVDQASGGKSIG